MVLKRRMNKNHPQRNIAMKLPIQILALFGALLLLGCEGSIVHVDEKPDDSTGTGTGSVRYVGTRSSYYGFKPFPEPQEIGNVFLNMANKLEEEVPVDINTVPASVWIVGGIHGSTCKLEFPGTSSDTNITFQNDDKHEEYLTHFDNIDAKVFLQVEAGMSNMDTLLTLVMNQYKHHPSVVGFGVDVEWYPSKGETNGVPAGLSVPLDTEKLKQWDKRIKTEFGNSDYRIFVKHWLSRYCGDTPVSDVIYVNSGQNLGSLSGLVGFFEPWANTFSPNDVGFQIGYDKDKHWWGTMSDPVTEISEALEDAIAPQTSHIFWADFTIQDPMLDYLWENPAQ